jgi:translation factor GUF1, mitochondrial
MSTKPIAIDTIQPDNVRNFSIIAHIDHGKSTLSDRLLEYTGTISDREKKEQFLDKLQVERERGITVKAQTASMFYEYKGNRYMLNLIDTPGHVDFSYEVSRSLYACQGALLLVDAAQGVQAQTMANFYLAFEQELAIIPIMNKIDLPTADPERIINELDHLFNFKKEEIIPASAKAGIGIIDILHGIIERIPAPHGSRTKLLKALLFDSWYDEYRGVVCLIALRDGILKKNDRVTLAQTGLSYDVLELGIMHPEATPLPGLYAGQVGYIILGMKTVKEARVGDTLFHYKVPVESFPGFRPAKPVVFAGIYPIDGDHFEQLYEAIEKLTLNDASVTVEKKSSAALGLGFRCGFLGLLHMDVFRQRLEQEYGLSVIATAPSVLYKIKLKQKEPLIDIENPSEFPDAGSIEEIFEPMIDGTIIVPTQYLGALLSLCEDRRGIQKEMTFLEAQRVILKYRLPLTEIATDFYDELKSRSSGYASFDYEQAGYASSKLVKMDILLNGNAVDALSCIVHVDKAYYIGRDISQRLAKAIPRQLYEVIIQAAIGAKIIARERIAPLRKDVTAKCYGGDITRKRKLLEKQKEGKKKMKQVGSVEVPQEAFLAILKK